MKAVLFLHGWGTRGQVWRQQLEGLSATGVELLAPTLESWEVSGLVRYLLRFPLRETLLVGWSLGGMLLLEALPRLPAPPLALVLVAVPASFCQRADYPHGHPAGVVRALRFATRLKPAEALADFARRCLARQEKDFEAMFLKEFSPAPDGPHLARGLDYLLRADLRGRLNLVQCPCCLIQGQEDAIVPPVQSEILHQLLPSSLLLRLPGAGHAPFYTRAETVNAILRRIIQRGALSDHDLPEAGDPAQFCPARGQL